MNMTESESSIFVLALGKKKLKCSPPQGNICNLCPVKIFSFRLKITESIVKKRVNYTPLP